MLAGGVGPGERVPHVVGVGLDGRPLLTMKPAEPECSEWIAEEVALQLAAGPVDAEPCVADAVPERAHDLTEVRRRREPIGLVGVAEDELREVAVAIKRPDPV